MGTKCKAIFGTQLRKTIGAIRNNFFFPSNLWGRWIGDCPCHTWGLNQIWLQIKEEIKDFWNLIMFVWHVRTYSLNLGITKKFLETWWLWINFPKKYICIQLTTFFCHQVAKKLHHKKTFQWGINIRNIRNMSGL